jgi:hypothetical protein
MSDCGGSLGVNNVILTFDDAAAAGLPDSSQIVSGSYKPANFQPNDTFAAPAPAAPYSATLSIFNGTNPNGTWSLYVVDDGRQDVGTISGGWSLTVSTAPARRIIHRRSAISQSGNNDEYTHAIDSVRGCDVETAASISS